MPHDHLAQLKRAMPAELLSVVRADQRCADFEITQWAVERLSSQGMANPDALFCFSGVGHAGGAARRWSVILKLLQAPPVVETQRDIWYWKRELLAAEAGLVQQLSGPIATPRVYATAADGASGRLWLEHIHDAGPARWTSAEYTFAAREIGRANGVGLAAAIADRPWLVQAHCRWWLRSVHSTNPAAVWSNPWVAQAFGPLRPQIAALWAEREQLLATLSRLPQIVSHFDLHRRNLFIRRTHGGADTLVAIDWGFVGAGALGGDLFGLVGSSALLFEIAPEDVVAVEAAALAAYLAGLRDAGWRGDPADVRLAYCAWFALWIGAVIVDCAARWTSDPTGATALRQFGCDNATLAATWAQLCALALAHADTARQLLSLQPLASSSVVGGV